MGTRFARGLLVLVLAIASPAAALLCGDGLPDLLEQCDDGNLVPGDGCDAGCMCELTGTWTAAPSGKTLTVVEGAGGVLSGAIYDPSAPGGAKPIGGVRVASVVTLVTDTSLAGVASSCGTVAFLPLGSMTRTRTTYCGDAVAQGSVGETCDDGNLVNGDGCNVDCTGPVCGNGVREAGESCDDHNTTSGDGCSSTCVFEGCAVTGTWGNRLFPGSELTLVEEPGGFLSGLVHRGSPGSAKQLLGTRNGMSLSLFLPSGVSFSGFQSGCDALVLNAIPLVRLRATYCGDGATQPGEVCDDGNFESGDACDVTCRGALPPTCGDGDVDGGEACDDGNGSDQDACKRDCTPNVCGDGAVHTGVETCDDGNTAEGDGCAADCFTLDVESVPATGVGGTLLAVTTGAVATPGDPVETTVAVPAGTTSGTVTITETTAPSAPPMGMVQLGTRVDIDASNVEPAPTAAQPMVFQFRLDASQLPPGQDETTITVTKDGVALGPCPALPTACVAARLREADGDATFVIQTLTASEWAFAASLCPSEPDPSCDPADPTRARMSIKAGARPRITYKWKGFAPVDKADFGDPSSDTAYTLCLYDPEGLATQATAPPGGTCGTKPCWKESKVGWKYTTSTGAPQGVAKIRLKAGIIGKPVTMLKAHGDSLVIPDLPLLLPAAAQLRSADGVCFAATFSGPSKNDPTQFVAKGD